MTRNEEIAKVLRAAAEGYLAPYQPVMPQGCNGGSTMFSGGGGGGFAYISYSEKDYNEAKCVASAFNAIARVYEALAMAEKEESKTKTL